MNPQLQWLSERERSQMSAFLKAMHTRARRSRDPFMRAIGNISTVRARELNLYK